MFDLMTTAALADEISARVDGGRVQMAGLVRPDMLVLEFYAVHRRHSLVVSLGGREPAAWFASGDIRPDPSLQTPFTLLLRKYLRGALITAVTQPPLDRVIHLSFAKLIDRDADGDPDQPDEETTSHEGRLLHSMLSIEIMGRRSNVVLVRNDGVVLDALKRVTPQMSGVRPILPKRPYNLPPASDRLDPRALTTAKVVAAAEMAKPGESIAELLVRTVAGTSPQMAREIACRATGEATVPAARLDVEAAARVVGQIEEQLRVIAAGNWQPTVVFDSDGEAVAYGAIPLASVDQNDHALVSGESISWAIEEFRGSSPVSSRHAGRRERLVRRIDMVHEKAAARLKTLKNEQLALADGDRFRRWGEAIFANLWTIVPGQEALEWEGEVIPLPSGRSASETAQDYFEHYRKAGRGREQLAALVESARSELAYVEQLQVMASMAETFDEIEAVRSEWDAYAPDRGSRAGGPGQGHRRRLSPPKPWRDEEGNAIYVGRSGVLNDLVTFSVASPTDYWLHARGVPGAHVIVRPAAQGGDVAAATLERAAALAAYYSASRRDTGVEVDICRRRDVRKIRGAGPGMVTYRNERTVRVTPARSDEWQN